MTLCVEYHSEKKVPQMIIFIIKTLRLSTFVYLIILIFERRYLHTPIKTANNTSAYGGHTYIRTVNFLF